MSCLVAPWFECLTQYLMPGDLQGPQGFVQYLLRPVHTLMSCAKRYRDLHQVHDGRSNRASSRDVHVKTKVHGSNVVNASKTKRADKGNG